jgi:hypothetical protein
VQIQVFAIKRFAMAFWRVSLQTIMNRMRDELKIPVSREKMARRSRRIKSRVNCDITPKIKNIKNGKIFYCS